MSNFHNTQKIDFSIGDCVRYVVSEGYITKISTSGRIWVEWNKESWAGKRKGYFDPHELLKIN
jgi:hypothetical protein